MVIHFKERNISQGVHSVLRHLYFYTTQYGISVKQFTGKHQNYWKELPKRLRKIQHNPQAFDKKIRELERIAAGDEGRHKKRREQLDLKWKQKEIILNAELLSVLSALPEKLLAETFRILSQDGIESEKYRVVDLKIESDKGENTDFVEPDLLLLGQNELLMIEVKTKGSETSSRNYPPGQLLNYARLDVECGKSDNSSILPKKFAHIILVPTRESNWLEKCEGWVINTYDEGGRMVVDAEKCIKIANKKLKISQNAVREVLKNMPIFYRSWDQFADAYRKAVNEIDDQPNMNHWLKISEELNDLAKRAKKFA